MALLGIAFIVVGGFFMVHCGSNHGGMDPDLCALTVVSLVIVLLVGPLVSGRLRPDTAPALVLVAIAPLDLPPKFSRS
ncbi:MAG: hypothetical protein HYR51_15305 [Candidatus Rokubacteria bacterium]|nr:hypothetical protein [Candidatus Rokubacteria bacterium]